MAENYTWRPIYKKIVEWLADKEQEQTMLIDRLISIGITGFNDYGENDRRITLDEIDPFTFLSYLNKYGDTKRLEYLKKLAKTIDVEPQEIEALKDVDGLPTINAMKVWLFPYKKDRKQTDIGQLWELFGQARRHEINDELLAKVFDIKGVGRGKLSICWYYTDPEFYLPLDTRTVTYLKHHKIEDVKYRYDTWAEYSDIKDKAFGQLSESHPFVISELAYIFYSTYKIPDSQFDNTIEFDSNEPGNFEIDIDAITPEEKIIDSVSSFLKLINDNEKMNMDATLYYRGHANTHYKLIPSVYRDPLWIENEDIMFKELEAELPEEFADCRCTFDRLVKMQHYELPTRLLDITANPLVALYFACQPVSKTGEQEASQPENVDGAIYMFYIDQDDPKVKYSDSDAVSVVSNIARRSSDFEVASIANYSRDAFNEESQIGYLLHEIQCCDKPHFLPYIDKNDIESVFFVKPKKSNPRIVKQDGAFFLFGIKGSKQTCSDQMHFLDEYNFFQIPADKKHSLLKELEKMGINEATLFPEINKMSTFIKKKYATAKE